MKRVPKRQQQVDAYAAALRKTRPWLFAKKPRKPLRQMSAKRAKENAEYAKLRKAFLSERPVCEAYYPDICTGRATQVHHMAGRRGKMLLARERFLACCARCHTEIHNHPLNARALGFLI